MSKQPRLSASGGLAFAQEMYMARLEMSHPPKVKVYQVDPTAMHIPDYNLDRRKVIPRAVRAWHGTADRKLCPPGFAAFGGTEELALQSLLRVMRETRDRQEVPGLGVAIRVVVTAIGERNASRAAV